jgi:hypothetical protein
MPRVNTQKKSTRGKDIRCGRCGADIVPGEEYFKWSFRYGGTRTNCHLHRPRPSELTQSKLSGIYAAVESAEDTLKSEGLTVADIHEAVGQVAEVTEEVASEYEEAAEPFNYQGEHQERADELRDWGSELEGFYPDESDDVQEVRDEALELVGGCPL